MERKHNAWACVITKGIIFHRMKPHYRPIGVDLLSEQMTAIITHLYLIAVIGGYGYVHYSNNNKKKLYHVGKCTIQMFPL